VSAVEKVLIPFEKHLPSTDIEQLLVTSELIDDPEAELITLKNNKKDPERIERFERATKQELENLKNFITSKSGDFNQRSGLEISTKRAELIAGLYLKRTSDINTAFENLVEMYNQIKQEEASLIDKLDISIAFEDSAIDELIMTAIKTDTEAGTLAFEMNKKLEYGLKLVRDRSGIDHFTINSEAVTDMDNYINNLVKKYYRQEYDPNLFENRHVRPGSED
jgi:ATP-dependent protease Clp ATPase subunit